jgi:hypothetical protein
MSLQDAIQRAILDQGFAQELKDHAISGMRAGSDTDEWEAFMAYFAENPQQLALLRSLDDPGGGCTYTTGLTMAVTSTVACGFTTTTTTASFFC